MTDETHGAMPPLPFNPSAQYDREFGKQCLATMGSFIYEAYFQRRLGVIGIRKLTTDDLREARFTPAELLAYVFFLWRQAHHWGYLPDDDDAAYWENFDLALAKALETLKSDQG